MLAQVIKVDHSKCTNCHTCIAVCPVKFCIDGSGDTISLNHELCIGCGNCIKACTHGARGWLDDSEAFFAALRKKEKIVAVAAPAVIASFPSTYLNLNGYLKSLGVSAVFDVSFGAELTVKSYLAHIKENKPGLVIAQPCPAIVTYIELYKPELLKHLAPADSPMLHTIKMVREYYPAYRDCKVAVLSPCLAKRREFDETGVGDFNVALRSIEAHLEEKAVRLEAFPAVPFANPDPERAVLFSAPGGLLQTAEREVPGIGSKTRKIEGPEIIYPYLDKLADSLAKGTNPLLVDCLNCELGCNGGPGTDKAGESPDALEYPVNRRREELQKKYAGKFKLFPHSRLRKTIDRFWKKGLYDRTYRDLSNTNPLKLPSKEEARKIHERMKKFEEKDFYNCTACGYRSCDGMTIAIFNGLNKPENCHHYLLCCMEKEKTTIKEFDVGLNTQIAEARELIKKMSDLIGELNGKTHNQAAALEQSSAAIEEVIASINSASQASLRKKASIDGLLGSIKKGRSSMDVTIRAIDEILKSIDAVGETIRIIDGVAKNTNLLSMNAAIEAAHAGNAGRGFSVVAAEIRRLSETTQKNSQTISKTLSRIIDGISSTSQHSSETGGLINEVNDGILGVADNMTELINTMNEMAEGSGQITKALADLSRISEDVKASYGDMSTMVREIQGTMEKMSAASIRNLESSFHA